jgi:monooxygenase
MPDQETENHLIYDVLIVGAGLSGIGTAYWLQDKCPDKKYIILEAREAMGGTWDLFRYPGIRSDSDMFTFGYTFKPWNNPQSLSDGASILKYLHETAHENGIDKHICFGHKVLSANWYGEESCWTLEVQTKEETRYIRTRFLYMCSGYYSYDEAHRPVFKGEESYKGQVVLPQFWPGNLNYSGKRVLIVGSGATAVTLVPAMAQTAQHVIMLQRSPTYVMNLPNRNGVFVFLKKWIGDTVAYKITRWYNLLTGAAFFKFSRTFPGLAKKLIMKLASSQLAKGYAVDKHFNPRYNPWDQRLCVVPDGDLFRVIKEGKASVVTDEVAQFTERGILLKSGEQLEADMIVLATGLKLKILGGARIAVDGKEVDTNQVLIYKGMMASSVPNMALAFGYTNNAWTLKTDLTAQYICRLLRYMDAKGYSVVVPRPQAGVTPEPFLNFDSGYVKRASSLLPKQGSRKPWRVYQSYFMDKLTIRFGGINDGVLEFTKPEKEADSQKQGATQKQAYHQP